MVMRKLTCQPVILSACMRGLYLVVFSLCAVFGNMSWQYVNCMNCMTFLGVDITGGWVSMEAPSMHSMSSLILTKSD